MGTGVTVPPTATPAIVAQASLPWTAHPVASSRVARGRQNEKPPQANGTPTPNVPSGSLRRKRSIRELWTGDVITTRQVLHAQGRQALRSAATPVPLTSAPVEKKSMRLWQAEYGDGLISDSESATKPEFKPPSNKGHAQRAKTQNHAHLHRSCPSERRGRSPAIMHNCGASPPGQIQRYNDNPIPRDIQRLAERDVPLEDSNKGWPSARTQSPHRRSEQLIERGLTTPLSSTLPRRTKQGVIDFFAQRVLPRDQKTLIGQGVSFQNPQ